MENMEYNSQKETLIIAEYGRNVQNLINFAKTVEDKNQRQKYAERIVTLMYQMNPQNKNINNYRSKLWSHLLKISNYELDVDAPVDSILSKEDKIKPQPVTYPKTTKSFRHYGYNVQQLINKAIAMEDGSKKDDFVEIIGRYMKLAYRTWNREHFVSDEIILEDLKQMSKGSLSLADNYNLDLGNDYSPSNNQKVINTRKRKPVSKYKTNNRTKKRR